MAEQHRPFRPWTGYAPVFLLLIVTFLWTAAADGHIDRAGRVVLQAATLILALRAAGIRRHVIGLVAIPLTIAVVAAVVAAGQGADVAQGLVALINACILAGMPIAIFVDIHRTHAITPHLIMGLLCVYLLIGIFFSAVYRAIGHFDSAPFFAQTTDPNAVDFLYFSFVTLTTVGFGDLTAARDLGRTLAMIEAFTGQLYLVTIVALAVANLGRPRRERA